jgi:hypothetical protein
MSHDSQAALVLTALTGLWLVTHPGWNSVLSVLIGVCLGLYLCRVRFAKALDYYDNRPRDRD